MGVGVGWEIKGAEFLLAKMKGGRMGKLGLWHLHTYTNVC